MALVKRTYVDGETIITAQNLNDIQDEIISHANTFVPKTRTINSKALDANITLTASDLGAVPTTRTVNSKALSSNITLTAADVSAVPTTRTVNSKALSSNITLTSDDIGYNSSTTYSSGSIGKEVSDLNGAITSLQTVDAAIENGLAIVANGNTHAAIASGQYVYIKGHSTLSEGLYKATAAIPLNGTLSTSNVTSASGGVLNVLATHSSESVTTGITGVYANIYDGWLVNLSFYITTAITVNAGALSSLGYFPEQLRPKVNTNYLLVFAKANNVSTVVGVRVASNGEVLLYNIGGTAVTFQTIQGVALYPIV